MILERPTVALLITHRVSDERKISLKKLKILFLVEKKKLLKLVRSPRVVARLVFYYTI